MRSLGSMLPNGASREVGALRIELHRSEVGITHRAECRREPAPAHLRAGATDLELLEPALVGNETQGTIPIARLEVGLPEVGRFEDVAVGVDRTGVRQPLGGVHGLRHAHERTLCALARPDRMWE